MKAVCRIFVTIIPLIIEYEYICYNGRDAKQFIAIREPP
jgi:hypothetical protein